MRRARITGMIVLLAIVSIACLPTSQRRAESPPTAAPGRMLSSELQTTESPEAPATPEAVEAATTEPPPAGAAVMSGPFRMVVAVNEILPGMPEALVATKDGAVWLVTDEAVGRIVGTALEAYVAKLGGEVAGIDVTGRVWAISEDASRISAWDDAAWTAYGADEGWTPLTEGPYPAVRGGESDPQGQVWLATSQDVRVFDGEQWTVVSPQEMGMVWPLEEDLWAEFGVTVLDGMVWVTECTWGGPGPFGGQGIRWYRDGTWQGAESPVASGCALALAADSQGRVWAGVNSSLWRYTPGTDSWVEIVAPEPPVADMRFGFVDALAGGPDNSVWPTLVLCGGASCFGSCALYHVQGEEWVQVGGVGQYDLGYWGPVFDGSGVPWLAWEGGIYQIDADTPILASPLAARAGAVDGNGRVWVLAPYEGRDALWVLEQMGGQ